ncbi:MAG TPA: ATP-binding cassette domain-containing protein, partial [Acidimicrobiales bacterium]|nr:ATP-binding cassette domain-containing protein [Acidimicrobiales bacterium]
MAPVVSFRSAVATIGRFPALAGVDLEVAGGEVVVVEGPNGAGKTSLLRTCAGLLPLTGGTAEVCAVDLRRHPRQVRRYVGL